MSTKIEWTDETWNPITGCTKISAGCLNCYAERLAYRLFAMRNERYKNKFNVTIHNDLFLKPLSWKKPRMIFVNSMSDLFHESIDDRTILELFDTMNQANWHKFQILTKRSERLVKLSHKIKWMPHVWLGVTVENSSVIHRISQLKSTGAITKFVSFEPLLSSVKEADLSGIDWVIVGGESGPRSRPLEIKWVDEIFSICSKSCIPFFFKQWGGTNKKKTGRLYRNKIYDQFPSSLRT